MNTINKSALKALVKKSRADVELAAEKVFEELENVRALLTESADAKQEGGCSAADSSPVIPAKWPDPDAPSNTSQEPATKRKAGRPRIGKGLKVPLAASITEETSRIFFEELKSLHQSNPGAKIGDAVDAIVAELVAFRKSKRP